MSDTIARLQAALAGRYDIDREIGRGGMATVFLASDRKHNRRVALKVLDPELAAALGASRFLREIEMAAALTHPHILPIHDSGDAGGMLYYVMPYIEGESLRDRLNRTRQLPLADAIRIVSNVADGLHFAHQRGIVHRDVKPENILLSGRHAIVADFGVARAAGGTLTATGITLGTPHYMSPEQASGDREIDGRSDIYALGCVLYEVLAGEPPFTGSTVQSIITKHITQDPPSVRALRPTVPIAVERVIMRALAKSPADRYEDAASMASALEAIGTQNVATGDASHASAVDVDEARPLGSVPSHSAGRRSPAAGVPSAGQAPAGALWRRKLGIPLGIIGVAAVAGLWLWQAESRPPTSEAPPDAVARTQSVAVLPFEEIGVAQESTYFADGLTEELIAAIGRVPGVRVISRTSAFAFRDKRGLTLRQIADSLRVESVLEGSVRRESNRLRVIARLVDVAADSQLMAREFDRELRDVFALQNEMAQDIASALRVSLLAPSGLTPKGPSTNDVEAYDLYLKGRAYWNQRTPSALRMAIASFDAAIARDSSFAAAYVGLSDAFTLRGLLGVGSHLEMRTRALAAAERALAIDTLNGGAHAALGHALFNFNHDYERGESHLERALALDSSHNEARLFLGILHNDMGRFDRSIALLQEAVERDPLSPPIRTTLGRVYLSPGRTGEALEQLRVSVALNPLWSLTHILIGHALVAQGTPEEALAAFRRGAALGEADDSAHLAYGLAVAGQRAEAERLLNVLLREPHEISGFETGVAIAYAGLGDREQTLQWLERQTQRPGSASLLRLPPFAPLRDDDRFHRILRALGVPP